MRNATPLLLVMVSLSFAVPPVADAEEICADQVRVAVGKSMALIQSSPPVFFKKAGCVSCHHQSLPAMTVGFARERGFAVDDTKARALNETVETMMYARRESMLQAMTDGGGQHSVAYSLAGMAAQDLPADDVTDAMAVHLAAGQMENGYWSTAPDRPPAQYSDYTTTALSIWGLSKYAPEGRREAFREQIERATAWLVDAPSSATIEDAAFRLLGLGWGDAPVARRTSPVRDLMGLQRSDGGWAQLPTLESDAYATGQALVALHLGGGMPASHSVYQRGLDFLLKTQQEDGSWQVKSRSRPFQPYFESGFPHGKDQWISICATSWATMALMFTGESEGVDDVPGKAAE